jgi:hypothetical protein
MQLWLVEFHELYARHLCRHSQFGINVAHIIALFGIWYSVYGLLYWLTGVEWILAVPIVPYLAVLVPNLPVRLLMATIVFVGLMAAAAIFLPLPWWAYVILIPVCYELQSLSHKVWTVETDMTEFNRKYSKGQVLFWVLLIYEVPICLNYLLFAAKPEPAAADPGVANTSGTAQAVR